MKRPTSILPRTAVVLIASLSLGAGAGYHFGRGDSHSSHLDEIRQAARAANVNALLMCALVDVSRDGRMGTEARAEDMPRHYEICAAELFRSGEEMNWMPELAVAALVTRGRFVPFALAQSGLSEEELAFSASPEELRAFLRRFLRRWAELEGRAPRR